MDQKFAVLVEKLAPKLESLLATPPLQYGKLPRQMPVSGVYLFTEKGRHLYVGRSNVLRKRYGRHIPDPDRWQSGLSHWGPLFQIEDSELDITISCVQPLGPGP
jgi:hypothetical protein